MNELEKAARQALEALEMALRYHGVMLLSDPPKDAWKYHGVEGEANKAITALRRILAEHALDKKAENARELGLDYEPVALNQGVPPMLPQQKEGETFAVSYEQPADEPVALQMDVIVVNLVRAGINKHHARELAEHFIKHTRPQPAAWVGLTDEEREAHRDSWKSNIHDEEFEEIEAKLREKNGGKA